LDKEQEKTGKITYEETCLKPLFKEALIRGKEVLEQKGKYNSTIKTVQAWCYVYDNY
jgi:hypothetical protein